MEDVLNFLVRSGAMSRRRADVVLCGESSAQEDRSCGDVKSEALARFAEEARRGVALSRLGERLWPSVSDSGRRTNSFPELAWQRRSNYDVFFRACKEAGIKTDLRADDLDQGRNLHLLLKTLRSVAQKLQEMEAKRLRKERKEAVGQPENGVYINVEPNVGIDEEGHARVKALIERIARASAPSGSVRKWSNPYPRQSRSLKRSATEEENLYALPRLYSNHKESMTTNSTLAVAASGSQTDLMDDQDYYELYVASEREDNSSSLTASIEEKLEDLRMTEERYVARLSLLPLIVRHHPDRRSPVFKLLQNMMPVVEEALKFHASLKPLLEEACQEIGLVFVRMKEGFLVYAPLVDKCANTMQSLREGRPQEGFNAENDAVHKILVDSQKQEIGRPPIKLQELLYCPNQHIMRYKIFLDEMLRIARKRLTGASVGVGAVDDIWLHDFYENLKLGILAVDDVVHYVNEYRRDGESLMALDDGLAGSRLARTPELAAIDFGCSFGQKKFDAYIDYRPLYGKKTDFTKKYLYCFQELLLLCNIISNKNDAAGEAFAIFMWIKVDNIYEVHRDDGDGTIRIRSRNQSNAQVNDGCFELKPPHKKALEELEEKFKDLTQPLVLDAAHNGTCGMPGKGHTVGKWEIWNRWASDEKRFMSDSASSEFPVCQLGECGMLLRGRICVGIRCQSCKKVFHKECFLKGESPFARFPADHGASAPNPNEDVVLGSKEMAEKMKNDTKAAVGTYIFYRNEENQLRLAIKKVKNGTTVLKKHIIEEYGNGFKVHGQSPRQKQSRLSDVVESEGLLVGNYAAQAADHEDTDDEEESENQMEIKAKACQGAPQVPPGRDSLLMNIEPESSPPPQRRPSQPNRLSQIPRTMPRVRSRSSAAAVNNQRRSERRSLAPADLKYFVGVMSKGTAAATLRNEYAGTFLLRHNEKRELRLSVRLNEAMAEDLNMGAANFLHVEIEEEQQEGRGSLFIAGSVRAQDLPSLVEKLKGKFFLTTPFNPCED